MHSNVVCFTTHRLTNTTIRGNGCGKAKVNGLINTLHNPVSYTHLTLPTSDLV